MPLVAPNKNHNRGLAQIFHHMAACYRYLGTEHRFRSLAYEKASKTIEALKEDISNYATDIASLDKLSGIGESIAEKIMEYLHTGKVDTYEQLKKQVPVGLLELMDITGYGPATVKLLHEKLGVNDRKDLVKAIENRALEGLKGFGQKKDREPSPQLQTI